MTARLQLRQRSKVGRIVIKVGSGVLTDPEGRLDPKTIRRLTNEIAPLIGLRRWPTIVSSGAIAVGMGLLGLKTRPKTMPGLQAAAAVGQSKLVEAWSNAFRKYDVPVAQVLLTHADLSDRRRFLNARRALGELERKKAVAVVNENDTVSFEEIAVGDNDELAAHVSNLVDADLLVLMSVAPGILRGDGSMVDEAQASDTSLDALVQRGRSKYGTGGMASKIRSARIAAARGCTVAIVPGKTPGVLGQLLEGEPVGTLLLPSSAAERLNSRAHWIAHTLRPRGALVVDPGAAKALEDQKKSLLPSGIVEVVGRFGEGDPVDIASGNGSDRTVFARGLTRYSSDEVRVIAGKKSDAIASLLGFSAGSEAVHRDDLVILDLDERRPLDRGSPS